MKGPKSISRSTLLLFWTSKIINGWKSTKYQQNLKLHSSPLFWRLAQDELWLEPLFCAISSGSGWIKEANYGVVMWLLAFIVCLESKKKKIPILQETWKNIKFGPRGRTSFEHFYHGGANFEKRRALWGPKDKIDASVTLLYCSPVGWNTGEGRPKGSRKNVPEGAVRQTESRDDAIDSNAKPLITEFLGGHSAELCVHRKRMRCVLDCIRRGRRETQPR